MLAGMAWAIFESAWSLVEVSPPLPQPETTLPQSLLLRREGAPTLELPQDPHMILPLTDDRLPIRGAVIPDPNGAARLGAETITRLW